MSEPEYNSSSKSPGNRDHPSGEARPREASAQRARSIIAFVVAENPPGAELERLREMSVGRMQSSLPQEERILWGEAAIMCARKKREMGFIDPLSSATEEARVRSYVIREFKEIKIGESWGISQLCRLVLDSIPYPLEDIREKASRWCELNREEMLTLRRIKNLLNTLKNVEDIVQQEGRRCEEVKEWLNVVPNLP